MQVKTDVTNQKLNPHFLLLGCCSFLAVPTAANGTRDGRSISAHSCRSSSYRTRLRKTSTCLRRHGRRQRNSRLQLRKSVRRLAHHIAVEDLIKMSVAVSRDTLLSGACNSSVPTTSDPMELRWCLGLEVIVCHIELHVPWHSHSQSSEQSCHRSASSG
jgi:hypothetical protein